MSKLTQVLRKAQSRPDQPYCPDAGDIIEINFHPQSGREQDGKRPALVLSPLKYNRLARLCVLCPITNQAKGYPFEVAISNIANVTGVVLADQVKSLSWESRQSSFKAKASSNVMAEALAKVKVLLQLP